MLPCSTGVYSAGSDPWIFAKGLIVIAKMSKHTACKDVYYIDLPDENSRISETIINMELYYFPDLK